MPTLNGSFGEGSGAPPGVDLASVRRRPLTPGPGAQPPRGPVSRVQAPVGPQGQPGAAVSPDRNDQGGGTIGPRQRDQGRQLGSPGPSASPTSPSAPAQGGAAAVPGVPGELPAAAPSATRVQLRQFSQGLGAPARAQAGAEPSQQSLSAAPGLAQGLRNPFLGRTAPGGLGRAGGLLEGGLGFGANERGTQIPSPLLDPLFGRRG